MESFFWCFYIPCCLYLVESFFFRFFNAHLVGTYFCYFHITCGLYFSAILLPLFVAGDLRNLVPAVFALHLLLTLHEFFLLFVQCTREVPYKSFFCYYCMWLIPRGILILLLSIVCVLHIAKSCFCWLNTAWCSHFAPCRILVLQFLHCMQLTLL